MAEHRRARIGLALATAVGVTAYGVWLSRTPEEALRDELRAIQFWQLEALLVGLVASSLVGVRALLRTLPIARHDLAAPIASSLLAAVIVFGVAPRTNRIYYDEHIYQSIGQNLADLRLAQLCNDGIVEYGVLQCQRAEYNKQPYGYPHLLSVAYRIGGVSPDTAHFVNALSAVALPWIAWLITLTLFDDRRASAFAALIASLIPVHLQWSHTAASEPTSALVAAWTMLALVAFLRINSSGTLLWTVVAGGYAAHFRIELLMMLPLAAAAIMLSLPLRTLHRPVWWALPLMIALCLVPAAHLFAVRSDNWGATDARLSFTYLWPNFLVNGRFYVWDARFPVAVTALALVGVWASAFRGARLLCTWFLAFFAVYLMFYAGSYNYGADIRYSLLTYPPLMILGGVGATRLADWLDRRAAAPIGARVLTAGLLFQFLWYLPYVRAVGEEAWAARADVMYARQMAAQLTRNAVVFTHNPGMFQLWGVSAAQLSIASEDQEYVQQLVDRRFTGGVFLHWNYWCNVSDPTQNEFCRSVERRYETETVAEIRERDYRYAMLRVVATQPSAQLPP